MYYRGNWFSPAVQINEKKAIGKRLRVKGNLRSSYTKQKEVKDPKTFHLSAFSLKN